MCCDTTLTWLNFVDVTLVTFPQFRNINSSHFSPSKKEKYFVFESKVPIKISPFLLIVELKCTVGKTAHMERHESEWAGCSECLKPLQGIIRLLGILVRYLVCHIWMHVEWISCLFNFSKYTAVSLCVCKYTNRLHTVQGEISL